MFATLRIPDSNTCSFTIPERGVCNRHNFGDLCPTICSNYKQLTTHCDIWIN